MIIPEEDGVSHINIYSKGKTPLGRALSNFAHTPFKSGNGTRFESVEACWYWYRLYGLLNAKEAHHLKSLWGFRAKQYGEELIGKYGYSRRWSEEEFKVWILEAIRCKMRQNRSLLNELYLSSLPLTHYYVYGETVVELPEYSWLVDEFIRIRQICKEAWGES